jgi:hypothetical protein
MLPFRTAAGKFVDPQIANAVYGRFIERLQVDRNVTIDQVLREEPIASQIRNQLVLGPNGHVIQGFTERDVEEVVIQRLYAEEETQDIQHMIAKFYNKFDELHEQSVATALARSPNRE